MASNLLTFLCFCILFLGRRAHVIACKCIDQSGDPCDGFEVSNDNVGTCDTYCSRASITGCTDVICQGESSCFEASIEMEDNSSGSRSITCSGTGSCQSAEMTDADSVICNGQNSCYSATVETLNSITCSGQNSCGGDAELKAPYVYCDEEYSCMFVTLEATTTYCTGDNSCSHSTVQGTTLSCSGNGSCRSSTVAAIDVTCKSNEACNTASITSDCLSCSEDSNTCMYSCTWSPDDQTEAVDCTTADACPNEAPIPAPAPAPAPATIPAPASLPSPLAPAPAPAPVPNPVGSSTCQCKPLIDGDDDGSCDYFSASSDGTNTGICAGDQTSRGCQNVHIIGCDHVKCTGWGSCKDSVIETNDTSGDSVKCNGYASCDGASIKADTVQCIEYSCVNAAITAKLTQCQQESHSCFQSTITSEYVECSGSKSCIDSTIVATNAECTGQEACMAMFSQTSVTSVCIECSGPSSCSGSCTWTFVNGLGNGSCLAASTPNCTPSPTKAPSAPPTTSPTAFPTTPPTSAPISPTSGKDGGAFDDPHIKTFGGVWFDYMSKCDLVLLAVEGFLEIFIRTETRFDYSFIESAVIRIGGEETFLVSGFGQYILQDVSNGDLHAGINGYSITHTKVSEKLHLFEIDLGDGESIKCKTFNDMVSVKVHTNNNSKRFQKAKGLMGEYPTGRRLDRAGNATIEDPNDFGAEWQVRDHEPMLFPTARSPQYPEACTPPKVDINKQRRLGESSITLAMAKEACASWAEDMKQFCIHDTLLTNDLELAKTGAFW